MKDWQHFVTHAYTGARFTDAALDVRLFSDIRSFHELLLEVAEHLWWQANPTRARLQRNFVQLNTLRCIGFREGSMAVALVRKTPTRADFLVQSRILLEEAIAAAADSRSLPSAFPRKALGRFKRWGSHLRPGEAIELRDREDVSYGRYSPAARRFFLALLQPAYEDEAMITGSVMAASVVRGVFEIYPLNDRANGVEVPLSQEHEALVLDAFSRYSQVQLQVSGRAIFAKDGKAQKFTSVTGLELLTEDRVVDHGSFWAKLDTMASEVPTEAWERVPTDASKNLDEYI